MQHWGWILKMSGCSSLYVQEAQKEADCRIVLLRCRYTNLRGRLLVGGQGLLSGLHPLVPTWQAMGGCLYCTQSLLGWRSSCISPCHVWWIALKPQVLHLLDKEEMHLMANSGWDALQQRYGFGWLNVVWNGQKVFFTPKAKKWQKFTWYPTSSPGNLCISS